MSRHKRDKDKKKVTKKDKPVVLECLLQEANTFLQKGELGQAARLFERVLEQKPDHADVLVKMAVLLRKAGRRGDEAVEHYLAALTLDPEHYGAKAGLVDYFQKNSDSASAVKLYEVALVASPDDSILHSSYAIALRNLSHYSAAVKHFKKAIELDSHNIVARSNYASLLNQIGEFEESLEQTNWLLNQDPVNETVNSNLLFGINYHPHLAATDIFAVYKSWEERVVLSGLPATQTFHANTCTARRLRIGYVSPDFCDHVVRYFIEPVFEHHDHDSCEIFAYAEVAKIDHVTLRTKRLVDHWRDTQELSDDELEAQIRSDNIDILVDLAGHSRGNRLMVFARKPAPIQISWIGYGYTTGLTAIDYFLADKYFVPEGYDDLFSEQVYRMPRHNCCYRPPYDTPAVVSTPALRNGHITFGSLSRTIRLNERVVSFWAQILHNVPGSKLMLNSKPFAEEESQHFFKARFARHGIGAERLDFAYSQPHWQAYQQIDITLDPFPHNGGTSTLESLWMGAPVITLAERPSVGRIGATCLHAVEMSKWIAATEEEYLEIAVAAAHDVTLLDEVRHGLRQRLQNSPLMDEVGFTRELEDAYCAMWRDWCDKA